MAEKIKIMIVDDEERLLQTLAQRLRLRDFEVQTFNNGQDALAAARREEFDLALVDLKMPGLSGEQVLGLLKEEHPLLEVIILTGHGSVESGIQGMNLGAFDYAMKPIQISELQEKLSPISEKGGR